MPFSEANNVKTIQSFHDITDFTYFHSEYENRWWKVKLYRCEKIHAICMKSTITYRPKALEVGSLPKPAPAMATRFWENKGHP